MKTTTTTPTAATQEGGGTHQPVAAMVNLITDVTSPQELKRSLCKVRNAITDYYLRHQVCGPEPADNVAALTTVIEALQPE